MSHNKTQCFLQSIGRDNAIALFDSGWWKDQTPTQIAEFQLFTVELCMPFDEFHMAVGKALKRPVWTHEFALNYDGLVAELLQGKPPSSMQEIIEMILQDKRILIRL